MNANRAQRRRNKGVVNENALREALKSEIDKAVAEGVHSTLAFVTYILNKKHGWGKKRLTDLLDTIQYISNDIFDGDLDADEISKVLDSLDRTV